MQRQSRLALVVSLTVASLLVGEALPVAETARANSQTLIVTEDFADSVGLDNWVFSGSGTASSGGSWAPKITSTDPALLLTENENNQAGFALYNVAQTTEAGFDISFKMSHWGGSGLTGGTGADGVSFFVKDGSDTSVLPGVNGSRLGYGPNTSSSLPGLSGALLGVGLDRRSGSATYSTTAGNFTCPSLTHPTYTHNLISLRGPGQALEGYCPLATGQQITRPWDTAQDGSTVLSSRGDGRQIRVKYDTSQNPARVKIWVDDIGDSDNTVFDVQAPDELVEASSYKFGFTASTGGSNNNHSIWDVVVNTVTPLPALTIDSTFLPTATQGELYETSVVVTGGANPRTFSLTSGSLPTGLSLSNSGVISGTPTSSGTSTFTVSVTDGQPTPVTQSRAFSIVVSAPIIETSRGHDFFVTFDANLIGFNDNVRTDVTQGIPFFSEQWLYLSGETGTSVKIHYPPINPATGVGAVVEDITIDATGVMAVNASERLVTKTLPAGADLVSGDTPYKTLSAITESFINGLPVVNNRTELDAPGASASDGKAFNSLRIQVQSADKTITVYGAHLQYYTSDAFAAIPTQSLGTRYRAVAWDHFEFGTERPSRISVIATQPGTTTVTITPPSGHSGLHNSSDNNSPRTGGYQVALQRGEVYSVTPETSATGLQDDVTGTLIESDKPVVVASGNECAKVGDLGSCDHLVQYLPATPVWGSNYILASSINSERADWYRVVADTDGTTLELNGAVITANGATVTLDAGEFYEFEATAPESFDVLESNHPVLVAKFIAGAQGGATTDFWGYTGDPSLTILTPSLQFLDSYTIATPPSGFERHSINVVVPTANLNSLSIVNVDANSGVTRSVASPGDRGGSGTITGTDYSYVRFDVPAGSYQVSADEGIGVYVEGFKNFDSYSYGGGTAFVNLIENPEGALAVQREQEAVQTSPPPPASPQRRSREPIVIPPTAPAGNQPPRLSEFLGPQSGAGTPPPVTGPIRRGETLSPPDAPLASVNGTPQTVTTQQIGSTGVRVSTGNVNVGITLGSPSAGQIVDNSSGVPELAVVRGRSTDISGAGLLPRSTVQVFMAFGEQSAELARIPVDANGTFNGQAALQTPGSNAPLPIGRHVLQVVSVDSAGNQTVVDMPINVAQPNPQPEILLENGETPALPPGQSLATRAGEPVNVNVIPIPDNKQTVIDGGDWTMSIIAQGDGSNVIETDDGRVLVEFVRGQVAEVSGSGFMPFTRADVWLFSEPTLLGTVDIDENGEFNGTVNVDGRVVAVGEHTLQLQGVGEDGYVRAANLGVVVNDADGATPTTEQASLTWIWWLVALLALATAIAIWYWRRQATSD